MTDLPYFSSCFGQASSPSRCDIYHHNKERWTACLSFLSRTERQRPRRRNRVEKKGRTEVRPHAEGISYPSLSVAHRRQISDVHTNQYDTSPIDKQADRSWSACLSFLSEGPAIHLCSCRQSQHQEYGKNTNIFDIWHILLYSYRYIINNHRRT